MDVEKMDRHELANEIQRLAIEHEQLMAQMGFEQVEALIQDEETGEWTQMQSDDIARSLIDTNTDRDELVEIYNGLRRTIVDVQKAVATGDRDSFLESELWKDGDPRQMFEVAFGKDGRRVMTCPNSECRKHISPHGDDEYVPHDGDVGGCIMCGKAFKVVGEGPVQHLEAITWEGDDD